MAFFLERRGDTKTMEGFAVLSGDGSPIGTIKDGVLVAEESAFAGDFALIDPESLEQVVLEPKD